jgi:hypothetical protein
MTGAQVARLDELEEVLVGDGTLRMRPIRRRFDVRAFGVNAWVANRAGDHVIEDHTELTNRHQEIYLVLRGRATFQVDGKDVDVPSGTVLFLPDPAVRRSAVAAEDGTIVLAVGAPVDAAFEPGAWEHWYLAYARADAGDLDAGLAELEAGLERFPGHPGVLYHLACLESRARRLEEALEHLVLATEQSDRYREYARDDTDLDPIRGDPRFPG